MPELPEVETVRRGLAGAVLGARITAVEVIGPRTVRRQDPEVFIHLLQRQRITALDRRGKFLLVGCEDGTLGIHLRMSGQLLLVTDPSLPPIVHTHAVLDLEDGRQLRFVDPRTFGELFFCHPGGIELAAVLAGLGKDPLVDGITPSELRTIAARRRAAIKSVLLDQKQIAGIGNIYADEICFVARVRPDRPAATVSRPAIARLAAAIPEVLETAVADRGSSLHDARYVDLFGEPGRFQLRHAVYGRAGEPCPRCGRPIERVRIAGRSAHFCPRCQR